MPTKETQAITNDPKMPDNAVREYASTLQAIVSKIKGAQTRAARAVNLELVTVYRDIGQIIHEKQETAGWGTSIVERLASDLRNFFPKTKGFSSRNLWVMRDLYISY